MTPKEKAKELIETFAEIIRPVLYGQVQDRNWVDAKKCALVAVGEVISACEPHWAQYWQQVKEEITKY